MQMDKDFMQYVYARIEKALMENVEYKKLQSECFDAGHDVILRNNEYEDLITKMSCMEQELCYIQGFNDAMKLIINSNSN